MRIGYLDCFAGVAGDMFLGALIDVGVPVEVLQAATEALGVGASLRVEKVDRSGISSTKVHVMEGDELAEAKGHTHAHEHDDESVELHQHTHGHSHQPKTQHMHKGGHKHEHSHDQGEHGEHGNHGAEEHGAHEHGGHKHGHGRSLTAIREMIGKAALPEAVKATAVRAFELLGHAEAKIHNVPVEEIHFHEVGAVDAIVDIVAASAGLHHLNVGAWYSSAVNVGGGMVECAHGTFPVPAPATADLLRGCPTYSAHVQKELVTPTGAALLRALAPTFGEQPAMQVEAIGYGAGTRDPKGFPNVLRLSVGEAVSGARQAAVGKEASKELQTVTVLETALDDASPQLLAYVAEKALAAGALDVMLTPVIMKKGRPGTLLTVLCEPGASEAMQALLLRETPTLGVRVRQERRACLERRWETVETPYGPVRMKIGSESDGEERNAAPEFEDCRATAEQANVPLKVVQQAAIAGFRGLFGAGLQWVGGSDKCPGPHRSVPQRLKPFFSCMNTARLKPCPSCYLHQSTLTLHISEFRRGR